MKRRISERQVFQDGMMVFLSYISRKLKEQPDYNPHPIIRAFMCAMENIDKIENEKTVMGVSQEGTKDEIYDAYAVVLQKHADGIEVKEIQNFNVGRHLPTDAMILIFRLQIQLDRIEGDLVTPAEAVKALNKVIPGERFVLLGDRWKEAVNEFGRELKEGKIILPQGNVKIEEAIRQLDRVPKDAPWEDYPNDLRMIIGHSVAKKYFKDGSVVMTTPAQVRFEKYKVFQIATELLIGQAAEFLEHNNLCAPKTKAAIKFPTGGTADDKLRNP